MSNIMLVSNSNYQGGGYFEWCKDQVKLFLNDAKQVLFIPFARPFGKTYDELEELRRKDFYSMGIELISIHKEGTLENAIKKAEAIFVCGGQTFELLNKLYENKLIVSLQNAVLNGVPYLGVSAGAVVAGFDIGTTNDGPNVAPRRYRGLNIVPSNIKPHFLISDISERQRQIDQIKEYHYTHYHAVIALDEGSFLKIQNNQILVGGINGAHLFLRGGNNSDFNSGDIISYADLPNKI